MSKQATTADKGSIQQALASSVQDDVPAEVKRQCLDTALFEVNRQYVFYGSILQVMDIMYSYMIPTAGVCFSADERKYQLFINPNFFCKSLNAKQRVAVLVHEIMHITNKHLIRVPFFKVSNHKRQLLNVAGDMSINQQIKDLPAGCPECPPIEEQQKGATCQNKLCCGHAIDVKDWFEVDAKTKKKTPWPTVQNMEKYYELLIRRFQDEEKPEVKRLSVSAATDSELDVTAAGAKRGKTLTLNSPGRLVIDTHETSKGNHIVVKDQSNPIDNGAYEVTFEGDAANPAILTRLAIHDGTYDDGLVKGGDAAVVRLGKANKKKGFAVVGETGTQINVDVEPIQWQEVPLKAAQGDGGGKGLPRQFDCHDWSSNASENDVLDATEDLVKRAMVKSSAGYDDLPANIKELLDDIKARRAELNYKALILAAIKRSASGHERKSTWSRKSRRYGNLAPGTKVGDLPKLDMHADTSGSISREELAVFFDIIDEFLKVGSRKTTVNLFSDSLYYSDKYRLGDRSSLERINSNVKMGGTCLESTLRHIVEARSDLAIIITDGYYGDVNYESWLKPGQKMPQVLWIISSGGTEEHPLKRLGQTVKATDSGKQ